MSSEPASLLDPGKPLSDGALFMWLSGAACLLACPFEAGGAGFPQRAFLGTAFGLVADLWEVLTGLVEFRRVISREHDGVSQSKESKMTAPGGSPNLEVRPKHKSLGDLGPDIEIRNSDF